MIPKFGEKIANGETKTVWTVANDERKVIIKYKDFLIGEAKSRVNGIGIISNTICCNSFQWLKENEVPTHFIRQLNKRSFLAHRATKIVKAIARKLPREAFLKQPVREEEIYQKPVIEFLEANNSPISRDYQEEQLKVRLYELAGQAFSVLEKAWARQEIFLAGAKISLSNEMVIGTIDNNSLDIRLKTRKKGKKTYLSLEKTIQNYIWIAERTNEFFV